MSRLLAAAPATPNVVAKKNPADVQPAHALDATLSAEPENNDAPIFTFEFLKMYTFMLSTTPSKTDVTIETGKLM